MSIDPEIMDLVKRKRTTLLLQKAGVIALLSVGVAALLVLVIVPFSIGNTTFSPLVKASGMSGLTWTGLIIALVVGAAGISLYIMGRRRDLAFYKQFTRRTRDYDMTQLARFMNALEGVAGKAEVKAPYVAVLDDPVPNAVAFAGDEGLVIGVTAGALDSGLEYKQVEAILAHELASSFTRDFLKPPGSARFEGAALGLLWLVAVLGILAVPIARRGNTTFVAFVVAVAVVGFLILASLWLRWLRAALEHDYLLADAVAVSLTGDRASLKSAIETMDNLVNKRGRSRFPESELGLRYLFAPPRRWSEDASTFLKRRSKELGYSLNEGAARRRSQALDQEMKDLADWSEQLLADRLDTLNQQ